MLRPALSITRGAAGRTFAGRLRIHAPSRQWSSSRGANPSTFPYKAPWAVGLLAVGALVTNRDSINLDSAITSADPLLVATAPAIRQLSSEDDIPVISPVKVLDLDAANQRIREESNSYVFETKDGSKGRVDVLRVASNAPVEDEWALGVGNGVGGAKTLYAGVYDGHAGWATSAVLRQALVPYVSTSLNKLSQDSSGEAVDAAIRNAFRRLDERIMDNARKATEAGYDQGASQVISAIAPAIAGSCALLSAYDIQTSTLRTAVTGDSRAVLGSWSSKTQSFSADALSKDQTGFNEEEVERLDKAHPNEKDHILNKDSGRLMGLAVVRAFGDHRWKWTEEFIKSVQSNFFGFSKLKQESKTPPYLTAAPEVTTRQVKAEDFVILASDGLWDCISSEDAVACVSRWLVAKRAGKPETVTEAPSGLATSDDGYSNWKATPEYFAIEDLDSAAVCLVKNAFGGNRRKLFCGVMTVSSPMSRYVRDDVTVQVIFFKDPYSSRNG